MSASFLHSVLRRRTRWSSVSLEEREVSGDLPLVRDFLLFPLLLLLSKWCSSSNMGLRKGWWERRVAPWGEPSRVSYRRSCCSRSWSARLESI